MWAWWTHTSGYQILQTFFSKRPTFRHQNHVLVLQVHFVAYNKNEVDLSHCKQRQNLDAKKTHLHLSFPFHLPHDGIGYPFWFCWSDEVAVWLRNFILQIHCSWSSTPTSQLLLILSNVRILQIIVTLFEWDERSRSVKVHANKNWLHAHLLSDPNRCHDVLYSQSHHHLSQYYPKLDQIIPVSYTHLTLPTTSRV